MKEQLKPQPSDKDYSLIALGVREYKMRLDIFREYIDKCEKKGIKLTWIGARLHKQYDTITK